MSKVKVVSKKGRQYKVITDGRRVKGEMGGNWFLDDFKGGIKPQYKRILKSALICDGYFCEDYLDTKAVAYCDEKDEFDERTGIDVCEAKLFKNKHLKLAKIYDRLHRTLIETAIVAGELCMKHAKKAESIEKDLCKHYGRMPL